MDDPAPSRGPEPVAGFGEPPRHRFEERCEAAAPTGFTGVDLHVDDLTRAEAAGLDVG